MITEEDKYTELKNRLLNKIKNSSISKFIEVMAFFYQLGSNDMRSFSVNHLMHETNNCVHVSEYYNYMKWLKNNGLMEKGNNDFYRMTDLFIKLLNETEVFNLFMQKWGEK